MPEPLEFRIAQSLQTALKLPSVASGYHYDVAGTAVKLDPNHEAGDLIPGANPPSGPPRPFILLDLSAPDIFEYGQSNEVIVLRPFTVVWVHDSDPADDDSLLKTYFRGLADVEKALATDITRGALASDTRILNREMREPEGREVWALVTGQVRSHRTYGAPNG